MNNTSEGRSRRPPLFVAFLCLGLGLFFLANGFNRPTIANMRTLDLLHVLATGAYFGAGLVALIINLVNRRTD